MSQGSHKQNEDFRNIPEDSLKASLMTRTMYLERRAFPLKLGIPKNHPNKAINVCFLMISLEIFGISGYLYAFLPNCPIEKKVRESKTCSGNRRDGENTAVRAFPVLSTLFILNRCAFGHNTLEISLCGSRAVDNRGNDDRCIKGM